MSKLIFFDDFVNVRTQNLNWICGIRGSGSFNITANAPGAGSRWDDVDAFDDKIGVKRLWGVSSAVFGTAFGLDQNLLEIIPNVTYKCTYWIYFLSTNNEHTRIGFINSVNENSINGGGGVRPTNSVYLRVITGNAPSSGFVTTTDTNATITNITQPNFNEWYKIEIEITQDSAKLFMNDVFIVEHTTDIPQFTSLGFGNARNTGASDYQGFYIDQVKLERL